MLALASVRRTTWAAISQFEGRTIDGRPVYVRYKWGELSVRVGTIGAAEAINGERVYFGNYGNQHNFDIIWSEVEAVTGLTCLGAVEDKFQ